MSGVDNSYNGCRNGWAATIVDTLTTTALMGLEEEFKLVGSYSVCCRDKKTSEVNWPQELNFTISGIDFNNAIDLVDPFETTIRQVILQLPFRRPLLII